MTRLASPCRRWRLPLAALLARGRWRPARRSSRRPQPPLPQPARSPVEYAHAVHFATDRAELSPGEAARSAPRSWPRCPPDRRLSRPDRRPCRPAGGRRLQPSDSPRGAAATVAAALRAAGIEPVAVTAGRRWARHWPPRAADDAAGLARDRQVEVLVAAAEVVLPGCPDWSRDPGYDPRNLPLSNLGCANAVNLGLMVADPGRSRDGRADRAGRRHPRGRGDHRATAPTRSSSSKRKCIQ